MEVFSNPDSGETPMSTDTTVCPLRHRMLEAMAARSLNRHPQRSHIQACKRFAAWLEFARYGDA